MSEYQYYELQALDRPLTQREMRELRKYSTRATHYRHAIRQSLRMGQFQRRRIRVDAKVF